MGIFTINSQEARKLVRDAFKHVLPLKRRPPNQRGLKHADAVVVHLSAMLKFLPEEKQVELLTFASHELARCTPYHDTSGPNRGFVQGLTTGRFAWDGRPPHPKFFPVLGLVGERIAKQFAQHHKVKLPAYIS